MVFDVTRLPTQTTLRFSPGAELTMLAFFAYKFDIGMTAFVNSVCR